MFFLPVSMASNISTTSSFGLNNNFQMIFFLGLWRAYKKATVSTQCVKCD